MKIKLIVLLAGFMLDKIAWSSTNEIIFGDLSSQMESASNGLLKAQWKDAENFVMRKTVFGTWTFTGTQKKDHINNQKMFAFDTKRFILKHGGGTFLDAKRDYYSKLNFDVETYSYIHSYPTLEEWKNLNHPPIRKFELPMEDLVNFMAKDRQTKIEDSPYYNSEFHNEIDKYSKTELTQGNELDVFVNGDSFVEKTRLVRKAKGYILGAVMAISCTEETEPLISALEERAKEGLDVRIIIEKFFGNIVFKNCHDRLKKSGVKIMKLSDKMLNQFAFMHNKFWIFGTYKKYDVGMIGGQNIARFQTLSDGFNHYNRDTDLRVVGPTSTDLLESFVNLWDGHHSKFLSNSREYSAMDAYLPKIMAKKRREKIDQVRGKEFYDLWFSSGRRDRGVCRLAVQSPLGKYFHVAEVLAMYTRGASKSIEITTPDMSFDLPGTKKEKTPNANNLYKEFINAANRGAIIDLISNGRDGGWGEMTAQFRDWSDNSAEKGQEKLSRFWGNRQQNQTIRMIRGTRELLKFFGGITNFNTFTHSQYIHAKQLMWDRRVVSIGSVNLDVTALERNHESTLICLDERLVEQMEKVFTFDLINSTPVISNNNQ